MRPTIERLQTQNIYGHLSFDVTFRPDVTFLYGPNSCGKTAVLRTINAILVEGFAYLGQVTLSDGTVLDGSEDEGDYPVWHIEQDRRLHKPWLRGRG